jgi:hypothetical protein
MNAQKGLDDPLARLRESLNGFERHDLTPRECLINLLADARHFAGSYSLEYGNADTMAHSHYLNELSERRG